MYARCQEAIRHYDAHSYGSAGHLLINCGNLAAVVNMTGATVADIAVKKKKIESIRI